MEHKPSSAKDKTFVQARSAEAQISLEFLLFRHCTNNEEMRIWGEGRATDARGGPWPNEVSAKRQKTAPPGVAFEPRGPMPGASYNHQFAPV